MLHDINRVFNAVGFTWESPHWEFKISKDGKFLQGFYTNATSPLVNVEIGNEPAVAAAKFVIDVANSPLLSADSLFGFEPKTLTYYAEDLPADKFSLYAARILTLMINENGKLGPVVEEGSRFFDEIYGWRDDAEEIYITRNKVDKALVLRLKGIEIPFYADSTVEALASTAWGVFNRNRRALAGYGGSERKDGGVSTVSTPT